MKSAVDLTLRFDEVPNHIVEPVSVEFKPLRYDRRRVPDVLLLDAEDHKVVLQGVIARQPVGLVHHLAADDVHPLALERRLLPDPAEVALNLLVGVDAPDEGQCRTLLQLVENICRPSGRFAKQNR